MKVQSCKNEEFLLNVPFTAEEVLEGVNTLKRRKTLGPDELMQEHLKAGGDAVITWLMKILNDVVDLDVGPEELKSGVIVPIYKRGGKDPLKVDSYRGITLKSMVSKVLKILLLEHL